MFNGLLDEDDPILYCAQCGQQMKLDTNEVSNHIDENGHIDYDMDADHVAYSDDPAYGLGL